jgi:hypothetical protein
VAGPSTAARTFAVPVQEKTTPLRYHLQGRYYDIFKRNRTTPEKLLGQSQTEAEETPETEAEETLGARKGRKRKATNGLIEARAFPKLSKSALERETKQIVELNAETEDSVALQCFLDCAGVIQRTLTLESASSLLSLCPSFFSKSKFLQQHVCHLTGGNDLFVNAREHLEFQMELVYQYLLIKLPKKDGLKVC